MADVPTFEEFFQAVRGFSPLPWQSELARAVVTSGWPAGLAIPTGLGKTSAIDVAVWSLASQAALPPEQRSLPTRTWYVVNRRLLVDTAYEQAMRLREALRDAEDGPLAAVADALRSIAALGVRDEETGRSLPLHVSRLRGGAELGARPPDPSQPALVFATVPMFASRWLFRGYGSTRSMRPVDAAHAGTDAVVLLDEAHLSAHLDALSATAAACDAGDPTSVLPAARARPRFVALTATGDDRAGQLGLGEEDHRSELVKRRLDAAKPTTLVRTTKKGVAKALVERAVAHLAAVEPPHRTCVIFVNTARLAPTVADLARSRLPDADVIVLTGRLREPDAAAVRARLLGPEGVRSGRREVTRDRPLVVVATQTLEVGADLDFDLLVTQSAGVRALTQRFGRLNRLGDRNGHAAASIVHVPGEDPIYGSEPDDVWARLESNADDGVVELAPRRIGVLGPPSDDRSRAGELLPAHLWEYAKTSAPVTGEAPVEVFFDSIEDFTAMVSVCWRAWLPPAGERPIPAPLQDECVDVPLGEVRDLLERLDADDVRVLSADGTLERVHRQRRLRPGDTVILRTNVGGHGPDGWDPDWSGHVPDLSILDATVLRRHVLPLHTDALKELRALDRDGGATPAWLQPLVDCSRALNEADPPPTPREVRDAVRSAVRAMRALAPPPTVEALLRAVDDDRVQVVEGPAKLRAPSGVAPPTWVVMPPRPLRAHDEVRLDAFDDLSVDVTATTLDSHGVAVGATAHKVAAALGMPAWAQETVALAGELHDVGKADPRFQRWLDPAGDAGDILAKGGRSRSWRADQARAGWPKGGRHELLSGRAVQAWLAQQPDLPANVDRELLVHLVQSHHGGGRPLVSTPAEDPVHAAFSVELGDRTVQIAGDVSQDDWSQPARFRRLCVRYGYWGLALLEAVLRQSDHAASSRSGREVSVA